MENELSQRFVLNVNGKQTGPAIRVEHQWKTNCQRFVLNGNGKQTGPASRAERQWKTNWTRYLC
jgi:hypothetical protein